MSNPPTNKAAVPASGPGRAEPLKVLVADGNSEFLIAATEFLKTNPNFETVGMATNGEDAIRLTKKLSPDLVLVDSRMTECDSERNAEEFRRIHPKPRVVVIGSHEDPVSRRGSLCLGADAYLLRSELLDRLDPLVEKLFSTGRSQRQIAISESLGERVRRLNRDATVVLIDDDHVTQQLVQFLLTNAGYRVHKAGTGNSGLALVREHRPDLVLLDVGLPDVSGIEVCKLIKADPSLRNTLVMHLSATHTTEADMARGIDGGADAYLTLPFQKEQLLARVDSLVRIARLEKAMGSNNAFFDNLFRKSTLGVAYSTPTGRLLAINESLRKLLGLETWQISGRDLTDLATLDTRPSIRKAIRSLQSADGGVHHSDTRFERPDGKKVWARITIFPQNDEDGKPSNLIFLFEDITPQKHAGDIRNAMLESIPASIAMLDREGRIIATNRSWSAQFAGCEISGRSTSTGGNFFDYCSMIPGASGARLQNGLRGVLRGESTQFQFDYARGEGRDQRWFRLIASPVDDQLAGTGLLTHMDITEQHALEGQLRQSQKMDALGQLAGGVAHDFSNLLMVIRCNADMIARPALQPRTRDHCLRDIQSAAKRAGNLTRQLLTFSRQQPMEPVPLNLSRSVSNLLSMLSRLLGESVDIRCEIPDNLPPIYGDPGMIDQILVNLAVNSRDAMPNGGTLTVRLADVSKRPPPESGIDEPRRWLEMSVSDTGIGIPPSLRDKIFEPFFTTKESGKGTGLGLSTVHGIVRQHAGWIAVDPTVGAGTTLRIHFPIYAGPDSAPSTDPGEALAHLHGNGRGVLVIEDDQDVLNGICKTLNSAGFRVWQAAGADAARLIWKNHGSGISLVVADIVLPNGASGEDLVEGFRTTRQDLHVVLTSGLQSEPDRVAPDHRTRFLLKPFSLGDLADEIHRCTEET